MSPEDWERDALFLYDTREAWRRLVNLGYTDAFRARTDAPMNYTFWDFQRGAWQRNDGVRIDHFHADPAMCRPSPGLQDRQACTGMGEAVGPRANLG